MVERSEKYPPDCKKYSCNQGVLGMVRIALYTVQIVQI